MFVPTTEYSCTVCMLPYSPAQVVSSALELTFEFTRGAARCDT